MEKKVHMAAISDNDSVMLFNALGIKTFSVENIPEAEKAIFKLVDMKCKIIYISENLYTQIPEVLDKYKNSPFPIIIPIPYGEESLGVGIEKIRKNVEKAVGIDIL